MCITVVLSSKIMRHVLSVSLPKTSIHQLKRTAKQRGHVSTSSYIQYLLEVDQEIISDTELLKNARAARKEYRLGHSVKASSMRDLV